MLEDALHAHLLASTAVTSLASTRIYPVLLPQDPTLPAITYQRISNDPQNTMGGHGDLYNPRIQIDAWARSYSEIKSLELAIRTAMEAASAFSALEMSDQDLYEPDMEIYRISIDFSCWFKST
ncbi:MAG: DUF3168 domain-containing protein [Syntrophaceae bacterium]|jgi:hypothetical protein